MTKQVSNECTADIIEMWKNCIEKALCVARYHMESEKVIDFDLKPESEYDCDKCTSEFCFKKLEWQYECGYVGNIKSKELELTVVDNEVMYI